MSNKANTYNIAPIARAFEGEPTHNFSCFGKLTAVKHAILIAILVSSSCMAADIKVLDATPSFWKVWAKAHDKPEDQRVRMFMDTVVAAHPELFDEGVLTQRALTREVARQGCAVRRGGLPVRGNAVCDEDNGNFHIDPPRIPYLRAGFLPTPSRNFALKPGSSSRSVCSISTAEHGLSAVRLALLFGIDGIARYHQPGESLKVFFDHELFHQYHDQVAPELDDDDSPLWEQPWEKGLATYISQPMNPGATEAQALMSVTLGGQAKAMLPTLAQELRGNGESHDKDEYAAFFSVQNTRPDLPPRGGYYVGYRVAQILGAGGTIRAARAIAGRRTEGRGEAGVRTAGHGFWPADRASL